MKLNITSVFVVLLIGIALSSCRVGISTSSTNNASSHKGIGPKQNSELRYWRIDDSSAPFIDGEPRVQKQVQVFPAAGIKLYAPHDWTMEESAFYELLK